MEPVPYPHAANCMSRLVLEPCIWNTLVESIEDPERVLGPRADHGITPIYPQETCLVSPATVRAHMWSFISNWYAN